LTLWPTTHADQICLHFVRHAGERRPRYAGSDSDSNAIGTEEIGESAKRCV
jgi:hypothetical protein